MRILRFIRRRLRTSTMSKSDDLYFNSEKRLDRTLIDNAAGEVKPQPKLPDPREGFWKLDWIPACQKVLEAYYSEYYSSLSPTSPEDSIVLRSSVKNTSSEVFELPAGKIFKLPKDSSSYIVIPLAAVGEVTVEAVLVSSGLTKNIEWLPGTMIYLKGTVGLRCLVKEGDEGSVVCIMLALNYEG